MGTKKKNFYANVSHDYVEYIADKAPETLRDSNGKVKLDATLVALGFPYDQKTLQAKYTLLTKEITRKDKGLEFAEQVYVRNPNKPHELREMVVYSARLRDEYPYKHIYKKGSDVNGGSEGSQVMVGEFCHGGELVNILDIGDEEHYNGGWKAASRFNNIGHQMRVMSVEKDEMED